MIVPAMKKPSDETTQSSAQSAADTAPTSAHAPAHVVTVLEPVRLFSPLVALIAFAVSAPALYRAFVVQSEPVANALIRVFVSWVIVWGALWVLHLLIGPVSPRQTATSPDESSGSEGAP
jgi:hypothetical protein